MAADWRNRFHKDVVVDLVGYRRHASRHHTHAPSLLFGLLNHISGLLHMPYRVKACNRLALHAQILEQANQYPTACDRARINNLCKAC